MASLTDFADQAVILPLVVAVFLALLAEGWRRGAAVWLVTVGGVLSAMLVLKIGFIACGAALGETAIRSPSGHTAAASVVVGALVALLGGRWRAALIAAALACVLIGASRLLLHFHTPPEVLIGGAVGFAGACAAVRLAGPPPSGRRTARMLALVAVVAVLFHGVRLRAEEEIHGIAWRLAGMVPACRAAEPAVAPQSVP